MTQQREHERTKDDAVRDMVREGYAKVARGRTGGGCCGGPDVGQMARSIGYTEDQLSTAPDGANLGLGCGNPTAIAELKEGEVVVDLGAGAGFDALIAGPKVGPKGRVIGVDMTPEMLARARQNSVRAGLAATVEFREGIIEDLPIVSNSADVVISNCVINLSPDKERVFREAFRVLKPGGRLAVSDIVLTESLPPEILELAEAYVSCVAGAMLADRYIAAIEAAGFVDVTYTSKSAAPMFTASAAADPTLMETARAIGAEKVAKISETVFSYEIRARKP